MRRNWTQFPFVTAALFLAFSIVLFYSIVDGVGLLAGPPGATKQPFLVHLLFKDGSPQFAHWGLVIVGFLVLAVIELWIVRRCMRRPGQFWL